MQVLDVLRSLDLGNSVAEHDALLERYFVETEAFRRLVAGEVDLVAGDKGTGKTALYRILKERYAAIPSLRGVEVVPGFNPAGNPVFQRLAEGDVLEEGQYASIWKAYVLALVGNWLLALYESGLTEPMKLVDSMLTSLGLRSKDDSPNVVFSSLVNLVRRLGNPKKLEAAVTVGPQGMPIVVPKVEFEDPGPPPRHARIIPHEEAFGLLDQALASEGLTVWIVLDRLDEAFQGFPAAEVPALRALLRTYLDLQPFEHVRLKLFLRRDLFRRVTAGGFVNLTHVNARRVDIQWDDEDLFDLLYRRFLESGTFVDQLGVSHDAQAVFAAVFPEKVDAGTRKPTTWSWVLSRIRDGNGIKPPRNLIDLVKKAQDAQIRQEQRAGAEFRTGEPLIRSEAIKRGLAALSKERVEDTLLAEAGEYASLIESFRGGKSEHNAESLATQLDLAPDEANRAGRVLQELGFLEAVGESLKVPMLYRDGLEMTQGKAFGGAESIDDEDDVSEAPPAPPTTSGAVQPAPA
jgi:hypothetical protein